MTAPTPEPQAALEKLMRELNGLVRIWREESEPYPEDGAEDRARRGGIGYCAGELAQVIEAAR